MEARKGSMGTEPPGSDSGHHRRTGRRRFDDVGRDYSSPENVRLDLAPEGADRAAAGRTDLADRDVLFPQDLDRITEAVGDAFHHAADEFPAAMPC